MRNDTDYVLLYRIAYAYYCEGQTQDQIAKQESISRPHVSRLLTKARECGIVNIQVDFPEHVRLHLLCSQLCEALNLRQVLLSPMPQGSHPGNISQAIAQTAAEALPELLSDSRAVGVGWGYTVYKTAELLPYSTSRKGPSFVPLVGITGEDNPYLQINVIVNRFAEKCGGKSRFTSVPAIRESNTTMDGIALSDYHRLQHQWEELDAAIIGLGDSPSHGFTILSEGSREYHRFVEYSGTAGDILAHFFYQDGSLLDTSTYYQQISLLPTALRDVETVICLAGGPKKVEGLLAAARHKFYNILITDPETAQALLDRIQQS